MGFEARRYVKMYCTSRCVIWSDAHKNRSKKEKPRSGVPSERGFLPKYALTDDLRPC
jgi:hypothetical protein